MGNRVIIHNKEYTGEGYTLTIQRLEHTTKYFHDEYNAIVSILDEQDIKRDITVHLEKSTWETLDNNYHLVDVLIKEQEMKIFSSSHLIRYLNNLTYCIESGNTPSINPYGR